MYFIKVCSSLCLLILFFSVTVFAGQGDGSNKFIVTTAWLAEHLNDPGIVLIEIGKQEDYNTRHIPGAVFMKSDDISTPRDSGLTLQIPSMEKLVESFEKAGVSNNSRIILYYGNNWVTPTARFYLTLDYMGLGKNTSILDGGLPQWQKENRTVTNEIKKVKRGNITVENPDANDVVDINFIKGKLDDPHYQIVDARTENFYSGTDTNYTRPGHIPGATNIPFPSLTTEEVPYLFKSKDELRKIFADANVDGSKNVICYCHIGQQASLVFFIAKYLDYNNIQLFDGSYEEWDKRTDLPVIGAVKKMN
jgi:thiosulfate/3-mercaptopyruvate sulfurtransferase